LHQLATSFVLGYHGCDQRVGERILKGDAFKQSNNEYDWLGPGIYFWEANPLRGLNFAREAMSRKGSTIKRPFVIGAVISLGLCLDLTTTAGTEQMRDVHKMLVDLAAAGRFEMPTNPSNTLLRPSDRAVFQMLHKVRKERGQPAVDTVKGIFIEGEPLYPGSGFYEKTHVQIAVCNPECIKGVFRVPMTQLRSIESAALPPLHRRS
jgi:hypothetical protein